MEGFNRHLGKSRKSNKQPNRGVKSRRRKKKLDDKLFATLDKHRKSNNLIHKITTERLTIRPGLFENAIRSDVIHKEDQDVYIPDDVRAVLNEDLFQYLDSTNRNNNSTTKKRLNRNTRKIQPDLPTVDRPKAEAINSDVIDDITQQESDNYGSLFRSIQEQYSNICGGSRNFDKDSHNCEEFGDPSFDVDRLQKLVYESLHPTDLSPQDQYYQDIVDKLCQIRRMTEDAARQMEVERCRTPDNQAVVFPEDSYHTPENQKYNLQEPPPSNNKFVPGIYVVPQDYRSTIRDDCLLENQANVKFPEHRTLSGAQPMLYHMNSNARFAFTPYQKDPGEMGITRIIEKRSADNWKLEHTKLFNCENNDGTLDERSSKLFKFDFDRKNNDDENIVADFRNEHHSFVHSRPKKIFSFENNFASPAEDNRVKLTEPRRKLVYKTQHSHSSQPRDFLDMEPAPLVQARPQQRAKRTAAAAAAAADDHGFIKPKYSPQDFAEMQCTGTRPGRVPLRARFSPNELNLRKKYAPHTLTVDELNDPASRADTKDYFMDQMPTCTDTPDFQFKPRFHM